MVVAHRKFPRWNQPHLHAVFLAGFDKRWFVSYAVVSKHLHKKISRVNIWGVCACVPNDVFAIAGLDVFADVAVFCVGYNPVLLKGIPVVKRDMDEYGQKVIIGYIASFPIPEVVRGINAFMLGAQSINPDMKVKVVWVYTWFDPPKEADAAKVLMDQGADIITQHTDSTAAIQAAADRGIKAFGQASDMIHFAPKTQLTAIIDEWGPYYVARTQAVLDGTWTSGDTWHGMGPGMVVMAPFTNMPESVRQMATETTAALTSGKLHAFTGPIYNQAGELVVAAGEVAPDFPMLATMNFYVQGIDDKLPE